MRRREAIVAGLNCLAAGRAVEGVQFLRGFFA
jgi:hypothetical protein